MFLTPTPFLFLRNKTQEGYRKEGTVRKAAILARRANTSLGNLDEVLTLFLSSVSLGKSCLLSELGFPYLQIVSMNAYVTYGPV